MILSDNFEIQKLSLSNFAANGSLGTAVTTVDKYHTFYIPQTTAGISLTLPSPTVTTDSAQIAVHNIGTVSITVNNLLIAVNEVGLFQWNGTVWADLLRNTPNVLVKVFTVNGVYAPTAGLKSAIIEVLGAGGGAGGLGSSLVTNNNAASGGSGGGYVRCFATAAQVGAGGAVTVGTGGAGGAAGSNGSAGGNSSVALGVGVVSANGGNGGSAGAAATRVQRNATAGGTISIPVGLTDMGSTPGMRNEDASAFSGGTVTNSLGQGGKGGDSRYGFASASTVCFGGNVSTTPPSVGYGAGGSGAIAVLIAQAGIAGNNGQPGIVIITEFI